MSLITFILFAIDKKLAGTSGAERIPEMLLLSMISLGGAFGGTIGMYALHHKTEASTKYHFIATLVLSLIIQFYLFFYILGGGLPDA